MDQNWIIVARGITPEKFIGKKAANPELKNLPSPDSTYQGRVLEGYATVNARSRSDRTGWTTAIAVPKSLLFTEFLTPTLFAATAGFFVSLLALGATAMFTKRVIRDVQTLSKATEQLSKGQIATIAPMHIKELDEVVRAMRDAGKRIEAEESFRKRTVEELAHRLRNKVATIQAVLLFQLRGHPQLCEEICARLHALSKTNDLIIAAQGHGADLREVILTEMRAYDVSRVTARGPDVFLRAEACTHDGPSVPRIDNQCCQARRAIQCHRSCFDPMVGAERPPDYSMARNWRANGFSARTARIWYQACH